MSVEEDGTFRAGMTAFKEKKYEEAVVQFSTVIQDHSIIHKAFNALGVVYSKQGKPSEAEACFHKALLLDPGNATYERNLGKINKNTNNLKKPSPIIPSGRRPIKSYRKQNFTVMIVVTLVACILLVLLGTQFIYQYQPDMDQIFGGNFESGLMAPWLNVKHEEIRVFPTPTIKVEDKKIEIRFDKNQDLSDINKIETVISLTKDNQNQHVILPSIISPQNNLYYAIDDPYSGKEKHLVMTVYYPEEVSVTIADITLPPR